MPSGASGERVYRRMPSEEWLRLAGDRLRAKAMDQVA